MKISDALFSKEKKKKEVKSAIDFFDLLKLI